MQPIPSDDQFFRNSPSLGGTTNRCCTRSPALREASGLCARAIPAVSSTKAASNQLCLVESIWQYRRGAASSQVPIDEQLQQRWTVALKLLRADAGDDRERIQVAGLGGGDRREGAVVKDDVGRHRLAARLLGAPGLEPGEKRGEVRSEVSAIRIRRD